MKQKKKKKEDLRPYRTLGIPMVLLLTLLTIAGILLTALVNYFF